MLQAILGVRVPRDGRLSRFRWRLSGATKHEFLLATGVLCYYLHLHNGPIGAQVGSLALDMIIRLLKVSLAIWPWDSRPPKRVRQRCCSSLPCAR